MVDLIIQTVLKMSLISEKQKKNRSTGFYFPLPLGGLIPNLKNTLYTNYHKNKVEKEFILEYDISPFICVKYNQKVFCSLFMNVFFLQIVLLPKTLFFSNFKQDYF